MHLQNYKKYARLFLTSQGRKNDFTMKIGILRETKTPPDRRVPFSPQQAAALMRQYPGLQVVVQPSEIRGFADGEYEAAGVPLQEDLSDCDVLMGVKEVKTGTLIPGKTYFFFSHTAKKQPYNRGLLQEILRRGIRLVDYEYLTTPEGVRVVAFGRWAGIVGAYNALRAWGERTRAYALKPAWQCHDRKEMMDELKKVRLPAMKILITGGGRVAFGALETLEPLQLRQVAAEEFLTGTWDEPVLCRIDPDHYVVRKDFRPFELQDFIRHPGEYRSVFFPFATVTDLFIACHYWDPRSPVFLRPEDYRDPRFSIRTIADVSCDIGKPIPSTLRASTIAEPFYGYDPATGEETEPFREDVVTVMAVDNLPGELPRDASEDFGRMLMEKVMPALLGHDDEGIIQRAVIAEDGHLTERFSYLRDYVEGKG